MQITETGNEGLTRDYRVTIGADDIAARLTRRLGEVAKDVRLPGFRPGKVPVSIVRQRFGQSLLGEILQQTVDDTSAETLKEQSLRPALQPKIEIDSFEEGKDLVYSMHVELLPEIAVPELNGLVLERLKPEIGDKQIDEAVSRLAERVRKSEPLADGAAAEQGDLVTLDYAGSIDGEAFAGGTAQGRQIELGSGMLVPGFEDQLIGAKVGDHVAVAVTFPESYGGDLGGKAAVFECDIKAIRRKLPLAIDDALADDMGFDNLAALRDSVREQIVREYDGLGRQKMKRDLLDQLAKLHDFPVPPGMVEIEFQTIWQQFEAERARAKEAGNYQAEQAEDDEKTMAEYRSIAERRVRLGLLLAEVGKNANIQVTQDEVNRAMVQQARQFPGQEKAVVEYYQKNPDAVQALRAPIYEDKVVDHIFAVATVSEKSLPAEEFVTAAQMDDEDESAAVQSE
jgi:trigger factor